LIKDEVPKAKELVLTNNEDIANELLALELMLEAQAQELEMWLALKDSRAADAWENLISAQDAARSAVRAHRLGEMLERSQERLHVMEKILFPPQLFFSIGAIVRESTCSICDSPYGECDHIKGRAYAGKICSRIISKAEVREVSIVDDPANKRCRVLEITEGGIARDYLTWAPIQKSVDQDPGNDGAGA